MIIKRSLLATIGYGTEGMPLDPDLNAPLSEEDEQIAEEVQENANLIDTDIQAMEDMEAVADAMEEQVLQNEVNLASIQGEDVPAQGEEISVTEQVENVSDSGDVVTEDVVIAEGEAPAAELSQDSSTAEVMEATDEVRQGLESMSVLLSNTGAFKTGGLMSIRSSSVNRHNTREIGIESIVNNPVQAYKQACLNYKVGLLGVGGAIYDFVKDIIAKLKELWKKYNPLKAWAIKRVRDASNKIKKAIDEGRTLNPKSNFGYLAFFSSGDSKAFFSEIAGLVKTSGAISNLDDKIADGHLELIKGMKECHYAKELYGTLTSHGFIDPIQGAEVVIAFPASVHSVTVFSYNGKSGKEDVKFDTTTVSFKDVEDESAKKQLVEKALNNVKSTASNMASIFERGFSDVEKEIKSFEDASDKWLSPHIKGSEEERANDGERKAMSEFFKNYSKILHNGVKAEQALVNAVTRLAGELGGKTSKGSEEGKDSKDSNKEE